MNDGNNGRAEGKAAHKPGTRLRPCQGRRSELPSGPEDKSPEDELDMRQILQVQANHGSEEEQHPLKENEPSADPRVHQRKDQDFPEDLHDQGGGAGELEERRSADEDSLEDAVVV